MESGKAVHVNLFSKTPIYQQVPGQAAPEHNKQKQTKD